MAECAFKNCINNGFKHEIDGVPEVSYHLFPKDPSLLEKWLKQMNQDNWVPSDSSALCSLHFHKDYFTVDATGVLNLKSDAIPTEFELYQKDPEMVEDTPIACCAYKCLNTYNPDIPVTFHPFPVDQPDLCANWLAAINCSQIDGSQAVLCSDHFDESCFVIGEEGQKYLISDAVPTLFEIPEANEPADEMQEVEPGEAMEAMETEPAADDNTVKYEISEEILQNIRRHDDIVDELMAETQELMTLTTKRNRLEKRKRDIEILLKATIHSTPIEKSKVRSLKTLLKEVNEMYQVILSNTKSPCIVSNLNEG